MNKLDIKESPFIPLEDIPRFHRCIHCGEDNGVDLSFFERFEEYVAQIVSARICGTNHPDYDVYRPKATFQVKFSNASEEKTSIHTINSGRGPQLIRQKPTWAWSQARAGHADFYIFFGVLEDRVYPFFLTYDEWQKNSTSTGKKGGRYKKIVSVEYSRCGRYATSYKQNNFWKFLVRDWPKDLYKKIEEFETF